MTFTPQFFEALAEQGPEQAKAILAQECFPDGPDGEPSPRAADVVERGEWDANTLFGMRLVAPDACFHVLGPATDFPVKGEFTRFCGLRDCTAATHARKEKTWLPAEERFPGFYVRAGAARSGVIKELHFPTESDGGPVVTGAGIKLLDNESPFQMTGGQWACVHDLWTDEWELLKAASPTSDEPRWKPPTVNTSQPPLSSVAEAAAKEQVKKAMTGDPFDTRETPKAAQDTRKGRSRWGSKEPRGAGADRPPLVGFLKELRDIDSSPESEREDRYEETLRRFAGGWETYFERRDAELTEVKEQQAGVETRLRSLENTQRDFDALQSRMNTVEREISELRGSASRAEGFESSFEAVRHTVLDETGSLAILRKELQSLRGRVEHAGIDVHGVKFNSIGDYLSWSKKNHLPTGVMLDFPSILQTMHSPVVYQEDAMRSRADQEKVKFTTDIETSIITSFATIIPTVLAGRKGSIAGDELSTFDFLKAVIPTNAKFDPPGSSQGLKQRITKGLKTAGKRVEDLIRELTDDPEVAAVALGVTRDTMHFATEWLNWSVNMFRELTEDTHYSEIEVWFMILECWAIMLEELASVRTAMLDSARLEPALYDYAQLKCWVIQQRYVENNFHDDPVFTGVLVRRILMHGGDESFKTRLGALEKFQNKYNEQHRKDALDFAKLSDDFKKHIAKASH